MLLRDIMNIDKMNDVFPRVITRDHVTSLIEIVLSELSADGRISEMGKSISIVIFDMMGLKDNIDYLNLLTGEFSISNEGFYEQVFTRNTAPALAFDTICCIKESYTMFEGYVSDSPSADSLPLKDKLNS